MKRTTSTTLSLLFLVLSLSPLAQPTAAYGQAAVELRGTVTDETGAYIPAAPVTIEDAQGIKRTEQTDERGRYRFAGLKPGLYTLRIEVEGFAKFEEALDLTQKRTTPFDVALKVFIAEQHEVKSDSSGISSEPDKNLTAITLGEKELEALPDDPDELLDTLKQMAGGTDANVYVGGFREQGRIPPKEAIQRVSINANPFAAEFSEPGFTRIEIITKPGSDTFHGGFNIRFNDESLNARNAKALTRAPFQQRNYGGNLSGPIIHNRWGFFFDMDRREMDENEVVNATVIDPGTLLAEPFVTTVLTPQRMLNFSIRSDFLMTKKHTLGMQYRYFKNEWENQGLNSSFDLPERAFNRRVSESTLRLSFTTIATERAVNEMRLQLSRRKTDTQAITDAAAINVLDAFNAGGNQGSAFIDNTTDDLEFTDNVTYSYKKHSLKFGFRAEADRLDNFNRANFGGTFTFGSDFERDAAGNVVISPSTGQARSISALERYRRMIAGVPGYRPSQFIIVQGDPAIKFSQWEMSWFMQDDWRVSDRLTLSYGLRHEFQTHLEDKLNFAPRFGLAWVADKKRVSTVRVGGGIFYNRLDNGITYDTIRYDGLRQLQYTIDSPNFFIDNIPTDFTGANLVQPTVRVKAEDLNAAYSIVSTVSYERQLPKSIFGSVAYSFNRGVHLLRSRNINAPTGFIDDDPRRPILPFPGEGPIQQFESTGLSTRNELRLGLRTGFNRKFTLFGNYTLAYTRSNTDGAYTTPADPYDFSTEYGRSNMDSRHQGFVGGQVTLPWGLRLNPFVHAFSGRPFNITLGRDANGDTSFSDRPAFADPADAGAVVTSFGVFNPDPGPGDIIIPRNYGQGPGFVSVNLNVSKTFSFGPPRGNFPGQAASRGNRQGQNQRGNQARGNQGRGNQARGGGGGANTGGPGVVMMRGGGGAGGAGGFTGGGGFFGGDARNKYNLTVSINANNLFNNVNYAGYNGVLTSNIFGLPNRALPARRIEGALRFSF